MKSEKSRIEMKYFSIILIIFSVLRQSFEQEDVDEEAARISSELSTVFIQKVLIFVGFRNHLSMRYE